ncbi:carboxymuconolactone decarboxylase family protein [Aliikangiella marina]|uniref:Carboxymuconolactone decarboxylase family protein n=1 Tax=Aliikangiella marina TaxID=1712262 RepID=A0A545TI54_9GAMM|nr:carboxymuconolactone decarboxylase family protein [Aliikangiella marina]TQV76892.1 carboxymuconolactone decarboxylase family protein [Aliikangiella marina]
MSHEFEKFREKRLKGNAKLLETDNLLTKRFVSLDKQAYKDGALPADTKELLGLVASMVLRCNDCIDYHLETSVKMGFNKEQIDEAIGIAMLVGGSIVIPHARHAAESLEFLFEEAKSSL